MAFGSGVEISIRFVLSGTEPGSDVPLSTIELSKLLALQACVVVFAVFLAGTALTLMKSEGVTWRERLGRRQRDAQGVEGVAAAFTAVLTVGLVSAYATQLLGVSGEGLPSGPETGTTLQIVAASLLAGLSEELLVLALPCIIVRHMVGPERRVWFAVGVVGLVALRMAYHLYQGPSAIQHLPWALAMIWVFYTYGQVLAMILAHTLFDVLVFSSSIDGWFIWTLLVATPLLTQNRPQRST